jgi:hypothetical protein
MLTSSCCFARPHQASIEEELLQEPDEKLLDELNRQPDETEQQQLKRLQQLGDSKSHDLNVVSRKLWLKNQSKRGQKAPREEQDRRRALANQQLRAHAMELIPADEAAAFKKIGTPPVYESANTVVSCLPFAFYSVRSQTNLARVQGWLEDMELSEEKKRVDERVKDVWAMVFNMPKHSQQIWLENEQLARLNERDAQTLHINTELEADLEGRTIHLGKIPIEHVVHPDTADPELSLEILGKLSDIGDVDSVTVRVRTGIQGLSWALVTFEDTVDAQRAHKQGLSVSAADHSSQGVHLVPNKELTVAMANLSNTTEHGTFQKQLLKHEASERHFRCA